MKYDFVKYNPYQCIHLLVNKMLTLINGIMVPCTVLTNYYEKHFCMMHIHFQNILLVTDPCTEKQLRCICLSWKPKIAHDALSIYYIFDDLFFKIPVSWSNVFRRISPFWEILLVLSRATFLAGATFDKSAVSLIDTNVPLWQTDMLKTVCLRSCQYTIGSKCIACWTIYVSNRTVLWTYRVIPM